MPVYCQRCGKRFQDVARVLNHMNQPISSCRTYYEEVLQIAETVHQSQTHSTEMDQSPDTPEPMARDEDALGTYTTPNFHTTSESPSNSPIFAEFYLGASTIFGSGPTFMDNFNED
jgi:hypothetical protein